MWVARNRNGSLELFEGKPSRMVESTKDFYGEDCFRDGFWYNFCIYSYCDENTVQHFSNKMLDRNLFPELKWEDEPLEVELIPVHK